MVYGKCVMCAYYRKRSVHNPIGPFMKEYRGCCYPPYHYKPINKILICPKEKCEKDE